MKQPSRSVLRKRCSKNIQQIYRRTPMAKSDFNKVKNQLYCNHFGIGVLLEIYCIFSEYLFWQNTSEHLLRIEDRGRSVTSSKRDSGTGVFLWILLSFFFLFFCFFFAKKLHYRCSTGILLQVLVGKVDRWKKIRKVFNFAVETSKNT